jgi:rhamnogalacturonyl hydrolase YesR/lysophospholipase L1-like esterase
MKKYFYTSLVAFLCLILFSFNFQTEKPTLYIIGDSTVKNGSGKGSDSLWGWGSVIAPHFDTQRLAIQNHAIGGRSSRTFLTDGRWEKILTNLKAGDFVIMQFGHNDPAPLDDTARARGTLRGIGDSSKEIYNPIRKVKETVYTYGWYMRKYVKEAKAKGAIPIICSLVPRNDWDKLGKKVKLSNDSYALWAEQIAQQEGVFFIDLNKKVAAAYEEIGKDAVLKQFFPKDHTHTDYDGARLNAEIVANSIRSLDKCPLTGFLNPVFDVFDKNYIKNTMIKVTNWQLKNPKHVATDWTNGAFYTGVFAAYETTQAQAILDSLMAMGERNRWKTHNRFDHADDIVISQTYFDLYRLKQDKRMIQTTIDSVTKLQTTKGNEATKHGITWWWCDALYMAPPTLAKMAKDLKTPQYLALNDKFYQECYDKLYDKDEHLFYRDWNYLLNDKGEGKHEGNGKKVFWSRGNGWVVAGLARLLNELPKDYVKRPFYEQLFKEMMEKVQSLQQADGMWRASLLDPMAYNGGEGSGSAFYCYAMAWGINNGLLDKTKYTPSVQKAWKGINTLLNAEGRYGWVQPIGADPRRNFSADSWEVFGSGAYLLAGSEVIKMK